MALGDRAAGLLDLFGNAYDEFMNKDKPKPPMMGGLGPVTPEFAAANQGDMPVLDQYGAPVRIPMRMEGQPTIQRGVPVGSEQTMQFTPPVTPVARQMTPDEVAANMPRVPGSDIQMRDMVSKAEEASKIVEQIQANPEIERQPGFMDAVKSYFGNRENMIRLAIGFNSMRLNPDAGLATALASELKDVRTTRRLTDTANKTVARLRAVGTPEATRAADLIEANPTMAKEIFTAYSKKSFEGSEKVIEGESTLRKEYVANPTIKRFSDQSSAFGRMAASATEASPAGDLALIYNFMKLLDPGSTVMQGEFENTARAGGYGERIQGYVENLQRGTTLTPSQRVDFLDRARSLYQTSADDYNRARDQYVSIADQYEFNVDRTVPDFYSANESIVNPRISYDQLPAETKRRFPDAASWDRHYGSLNYLQKLDLRAKLQ